MCDSSLSLLLQNSPDNQEVRNALDPGDHISLLKIAHDHAHSLIIIT